MTISRIFLLSLALLLSTVYRADADQPLVSPETAPVYQLSNIRIEDSGFGIGKPQLVIDYKRTRKGEGSASIAARTPKGELRVNGFSSISDASGEIRLEKIVSFGGNRAYNFEFYLTTPATWAEKSFGKCMVSNAVRIGDPGPVTVPRPWNREEQAAYEKHKLAKIPPATLPEGYVAVTSKTTLLPGMPVKAGKYSEWEDAEVIRLAENWEVNVRFSNQQIVVPLAREKWLAVDSAVLKRAETDPSQFTPSVQILVDGRLPMLKDTIPLASDLQLLVGTPLQLEQGSVWKEVYVLNAGGTRVKVCFANLPVAIGFEFPRAKFAIRKETLDALQDPKTADRFAANIASSGKSSATAFPSRESRRGGFAKPASKWKMDYPISIAIPRRAQLVPEELSLEKGTPLAACWGREWRPLEVLSENDDGTVNVRWTGFHKLPDCSLTRDQLIIEDKTARKLERKEKLASKDLTETVRTWTDASGKHKIEAKLLRKTETEIVLETNKGREITLPLNKLSDEDRELLSRMKTEVENPFAP